MPTELRRTIALQRLDMRSIHKNGWQFRIDVFCSAACGLAFAVLGLVALVQIVLGDFSVTVHVCRRYAVHAASITVLALMMGLILGPALIWRALSLLRERGDRAKRQITEAQRHRG